MYACGLTSLGHIRNQTTIANLGGHQIGLGNSSSRAIQMQHAHVRCCIQHSFKLSSSSDVYPTSKFKLCAVSQQFKTTFAKSLVTHCDMNVLSENGEERIPQVNE